jgi:hypothetical protein
LNLAGHSGERLNTHRKDDVQSDGSSAATTEKQPAFRVLLVGNYEPNRQYSILQYAAWLHGELASTGIRITQVRPRKAVGWLAGSILFLNKWLGYVDKLIVFPIELLLRATRYDIVHICDPSNAHYRNCVVGRRRVEELASLGVRPDWKVFCLSAEIIITRTGKVLSDCSMNWLENRHSYLTV